MSMGPVCVFVIAVEAGAQGYLWAQIEFKRGWSGLHETLPPKKMKKQKGEKKKLSGNAEL